MQLQYETQDQVPEDLRESFVEFNEGDKTLFMHKDLAETKKQLYRTKGDLTHTEKSAKEKAERLKALEDAEALRQQEREQADLENKKKNGQHEEILEDYKTKAEQREAELKAHLEELQGNIRNEKKSTVVSDIAALGTDSTRSTLKRLVDQDLAFGEDGNLVVMQDGKATSTTIEEYKSKLVDLYPSLVRESHAKGGKATGGTGSGSLQGKKRSTMSRTEKHEYIKEHGQQAFLKLPK